MSFAIALFLFCAFFFLNSINLLSNFHFFLKFSSCFFFFSFFNFFLFFLKAILYCRCPPLHALYSPFLQEGINGTCKLNCSAKGLCYLLSYVYTGKIQFADMIYEKKVQTCSREADADDKLHLTQTNTERLVVDLVDALSLAHEYLLYEMFYDVQIEVINPLFLNIKSELKDFVCFAYFIVLKWGGVSCISHVSTSFLLFFCWVRFVIFWIACIPPCFFT